MFSRWCIAGAMAFVVAGLVVDVASAQDKKGRGGGGRGNRTGVAAIAGNEAVQTDLGLNAEAKAKVTAVLEKYEVEAQEKMQGLRGGRGQTDQERAENAQKLVAANRELNAKYGPQLKAALTPEQFARLQGISYQVLGGLALADPELVKELAITKEQQDKITSAEAAYLKQVNEARAGAAGDFQALQPKIQEAGQQRDKAALAVLTKEQQEKFEKIKGKPFDTQQLRGGRGGRGRRGN